MPLHEIAASVRQGQVSAESLVAESLGRIERLDGPINAVVRTRGDGAFADAAAIDARVEAGEDPGPLAGLPLLVKDNEDAAGLPTTYGSLLREHVDPAGRDCEVVSRFRAAGAIVVGKTNLPEFAFEGFTANRLFGETHDPWALDWSPGGSSGGSGAALAAGMAPLATATDGGGSIRIPAAFCGLVGLKPTGGLIGHDPTPSWIDLSTKGPLAVSVADAALLLEVMRGPIAGAPTAVPAWSPRPDAWPARIVATPRMVDYGPLPASIDALFEEALAGLEIGDRPDGRARRPAVHGADRRGLVHDGRRGRAHVARPRRAGRPTRRPHPVPAGGVGDRSHDHGRCLSRGPPPPLHGHAGAR